MSDERIENLEADQRAMRDELSQHASQIAVLNNQIPRLQNSLDSNTKALNDHGKVLNEYSGARKAIHWIVTTALAAGTYFLGTQGKN